ncbi:MAG: sel1 repeat family protein [Magnetospirillum sp.]|nr:sel1 repeat family protein [Magnetospirillum sp.]
MRTAALVAALLAVLAPLTVLAAPAAKAEAKVKVKAPTAAETRHSALIAAALRGEPEAQYHLGLAYRDGGHGIKADPQAALIWFTLAGADGSVPAAVEAAKAFEAGRGARRDLNAAGNWWYRAGMLGDKAARSRWAELFMDGNVHSIGGRDGVEWLSEIADTGNLKAIMALGEALERGAGIAPDAPAAEGWYRLAALLHSDFEARYRLGRMMLARPSMWRMPTEEEWNAKDAERKSHPFGAVWYPAKPGNADDKAVQLRSGIVEGEFWLRSAANHGHVEAQYALGAILVNGLDLPMDMVEGIAWLEAASVQGHAEAMMLLGDLAAKGQGFYGKDPVRAFVMFDLAAGQGEEGAAAARDAVAKTMNQRQGARARQLVQDLRELSSAQ